MAKIDVEITSQREDGDWTWRAVGAREPKGTVEASLLPDDLSVGTQFSVETEHFLDGIVVTKVFDKKQESEKGKTLEILGSGKEADLVTTQLAKSKKGKKPSKRSPSPKSRTDERNKNKKDFVKKVSDLTKGAGVPVVYDSVGKDTFNKSLECLAPLGMLVLHRKLHHLSIAHGPCSA